MALIDARKAASMFAKVAFLLRIVENIVTSSVQVMAKNMQYSVKVEAKESARLGVPLIGQIPIEMQTREAVLTPVALGESETAKEVKNVAEKIIASLNL